MKVINKTSTWILFKDLKKGDIFVTDLASEVPFIKTDDIINNARYAKTNAVRLTDGEVTKIYEERRVYYINPTLIIE